MDVGGSVDHDCPPPLVSDSEEEDEDGHQNGSNEEKVHTRLQDCFVVAVNFVVTIMRSVQPISTYYFHLDD